MKRVVVTGASGFIGRTLCLRLAADGISVTATTRAGRVAALDGVADVRRVDLLSPKTDWSEVLAGADAVVHLAARVHVGDDRSGRADAEFHRDNALATRRLADAALGAEVRRFVLASTIKVNGAPTADIPFRETDPPAPEDAYGRSKRAAETAVFSVAAAGAIEPVVLRLPLVYGEGVKGNFLRLMHLCQSAPALPVAGIRNLRSLIYVGNVADAILACLTRPAAVNQLYLIRDGEDLSTPDLVGRLGTALGRRARLFSVPGGLLRFGARVIGRAADAGRLLDSLRVDDGKIRRDLEWSPPFSVDQGLERTVSWFAGHDRHNVRER